MYTIKLKRSNHTMSVRHVARNVTVKHVGRRGPQGIQGIPGNVADAPVTSVNSLLGDVVLTKTEIGLSNVDNTSDANKPVSTAQSTAIAVVQSDIDAHEADTNNPHSVTKTQVGLSNVTNDAQLKASDLDTDSTLAANSDTKLASQKATKTYADTKQAALGFTPENVANKSATTSLGTSDTLYPSQKAVKTYVDTSVATGTPDATTSSKGKVQLAGDLGGTAANPTVKRTSRFIVAPYGDTRPADYTCASATGNEVEINNAITAANALTNGGVVDLLDGTYVLSSPVVPMSNVWLRGQGMFNTKLTTVTNGTFAPIDNYSLHNFSNPWSNAILSDFEIDGSNQNRAVAKKGVNSVSLLNCKILRLYIHDTTATGYGADDYTSVVVDGIIVENCGYTNPRTITAVAYSTNTFTFTTSPAHGYTAWVQATGTLTASGTPSDGDTVTLGPVTYTFKTTLTGAAFEVFIGGSAANALTNLKSAVNLTGTIGTDYGTGTTKHPSMSAGTLTATTLAFTATNYGTTGNALATTETSSNLSFGATTLTGAVSGSAVVVTGMTPGTYNGTFNVTSVIDTTNFTVSSANNSAGLNFGTNPGTATVFGQSSDSILGHNGIGIATGEMPTEAMIITNNYCSGNQNNNYLAEVDTTGTGDNASYIFSNNISVNAGSYGYRNTGTINVQFNNNFDYGSTSGCIVATTQVQKTITAAGWSAGTATFTTSAAHGFAAGDQALIAGMSPTTWNGYLVITAVPTSTTFSVAIASDPGTALVMGNVQAVVHPVDGSSVVNNIFSNNVNRGIYVSGFTNNLLVRNNEIINCDNYGIQFVGSNSQISGNKVYGSGQDGINIATGGGSYLSMANLTVSDNHVYNNGQRITNSDGIVFNPSSTAPITNVLVANNQCYDTQPTKTQRYGILLSSSGTLTNISVANNNLTGNLTGAILVQNTSNSISVNNNGGVNPVGRVALGNVSGSTTFDASTGDFFTATLTGNITAVMPTPLVGGTKMRWVLIQDGTGSRTLSLPANASAGVTLTLTTTASAVDILTWVYEMAIGKWRLAGRSMARPASVVEGGTGAATLTGILKGNGTSAFTAVTAPSGALVGDTDSQTLTNKDLSGAGNTFPTFNQNTTGSAAKLTTARNIAGVAFDGTANISIASTNLSDTASIVLLTSTQTLTNKTITPRIGTVASSATPSINTDNVDQFNITALAAAITSMTTNLSGTPVDGQRLRVRIKDNGTARTITWGASFTSSGNAALPATTVISKTHMIGLIYDAAATIWVCMASDTVGY